MVGRMCGNDVLVRHLFPIKTLSSLLLSLSFFLSLTLIPLFSDAILQVGSDPHLVSIASHPVTNQLLCLDSNGQVYSLTVAITGT